MVIIIIIKIDHLCWYDGVALGPWSVLISKLSSTKKKSLLRLHVLKQAIVKWKKENKSHNKQNLVILLKCFVF